MQKWILRAIVWTFFGLGVLDGCAGRGELELAQSLELQSLELPVCADLGCGPIGDETVVDCPCHCTVAPCDLPEHYVCPVGLEAIDQVCVCWSNDVWAPRECRAFWGPVE